MKWLHWRPSCRLSPVSTHHSDGKDERGEESVEQAAVPAAALFLSVGLAAREECLANESAKEGADGRQAKESSLQALDQSKRNRELSANRVWSLEVGYSTYHVDVREELESAAVGAVEREALVLFLRVQASVHNVLVDEEGRERRVEHEA